MRFRLRPAPAARGERLVCNVMQLDLVDDTATLDLAGSETWRDCRPVPAPG